jgi:hypothetical protein
MIDQEYSQVLEIISTRLSREPVPEWAITGSLGFALQGIEVEMHDVDIQTDSTGAYEIERRLSTYCIRKVAYSEAQRIRSHFGVMEIGGIRVEIMGALQKRLPDGKWEDPVDINPHRRWVDWKGMRLPVLSVEYEYRAYTILGRTEKAAVLREWLERRGKKNNPSKP